MLTGESVPQMKVGNRHRQHGSRLLDIDKYFNLLSLWHFEMYSFIFEFLCYTASCGLFRNQWRTWIQKKFWTLRQILDFM